MTALAKYNLYLLSSILVLTVLVFGFITDFEYASIDFGSFRFDDFQLFLLIIPAFLWLSLIALIIKEWKYRFERKTSTVALLIINSLNVLATGYLFFLLYIGAGLGVALRSMFHSKSGMLDEAIMIAETILWLGITILSILIIFEVFMVIKLRRIKNKKVMAI